ncbi:App1 family protein [Nakamurella sp. GG22]
MTDTGPGSTERPHIAVRLDRAATRLTGALFRRRGWQPRIIPYTGYGSSDWVRILGRVLLAPPVPADGPPSGGTTETSPVDDEIAPVAGQNSTDAAATSVRQESPRGWRRFLTTSIAGLEVEVELAGRTHRLRTDEDGYLNAVLQVQLPPGWHDVPLRTANGRPTVTRVFVVAAETRWGMVSDIDDTVLVTHLPRPLIAAWNTFVLRESARAPVPGMAELYRRLLTEHPDALVVYLSTGAWNVAPTLTRFLSRHGYPEGPLLLTDWGPTNTGWFRSGREHKRSALRRLARDLPQVRWLLIGDDGQHDPEIYAEFAREHPDRVEAIAIRTLTAAEHVLSGHPAGADRQVSPARTISAPDGHRLARELTGAPFVPPPPTGRQ